MSAPTCRCGRPLPAGGWLCRSCQHTLEVALVNVAACWADLELTQARRKAVRYDLPRGKGASRETPMPMDSRFLPGAAATEAMAAARNAVTTWVRVCLKAWPAEPGPRDTIGSCCDYLIRLLPKIAGEQWAPELLREMLDTERALKKVDARGPERIFAGWCTICLLVREKTPLYAYPGDEWVTCPAPDCGMDYRVEARRAIMQDQLEYEWLTAAGIADLATYLQLLGDRDWVRKKINRWHSDGALPAASVDAEGNPLFPFGEVARMLVTADSTRRKSA